LVVLYVAEPPPFITYGEMEKLLQVPDGYRQQLETKLREFRPEDAGVPVDYRVVSGEPVAEILHAAEEVPCDLIVMGTHGRTGLGRVLLGSVAEQVVRKAPCPVLTVKVPAANAGFTPDFPYSIGDVMLPIRIILHPTDFSESAGNAFRLACSLARDHGAQLVVLHVAAPQVSGYAGGVLIPPPEGYLDELRAKLSGLQARDPKVRVEHRLVVGDPASEILRAASEPRCDVIVMGTHGRTGLGRLLMGSVAEQVVRRAPCPVVTVRAPVGAPTEMMAGTAEAAKP
jgi:nucleotide-binding universal stress UspA family protein